MSLHKVKKHTVVKRPAGTTAAVATLLVVLANLVGVNLDATQAGIIIGGLAGLVSILKPIL